MPKITQAPESLHQFLEANGVDLCVSVLSLDEDTFYSM